MKLVTASTTKLSEDAIVGIDRLGRSLVVQKDRYDSKTGDWEGVMQVLTEDKSGFYLTVYKYSEKEKRELFPHINKEQEQKIINLVSNFHWRG